MVQFPSYFTCRLIYFVFTPFYKNGLLFSDVVIYCCGRRSSRDFVGNINWMKLFDTLPLWILLYFQIRLLLKGQTFLSRKILSASCLPIALIYDCCFFVSDVCLRHLLLSYQNLLTKRWCYHTRMLPMSFVKHSIERRN